MRNLIGAISLLLTLIGLPGTIEGLAQWRGWAKFLLGDSYGPTCVLAGLALLPVFFFWRRLLPRRPEGATALPRVAVTSSNQSGGQTGLLNISVTSSQHPGLTTEEKEHRTRLADEMAAVGHTFFKRVNEWYTARVEEKNPGQRDKKEKVAAEARAQAEARMSEIDRLLVEKVNSSAAAYFRKNRPNEPPATSWIPVIREGQAINFMWHRSTRLDEIAARVRNGDEPIKWPPGASRP